MSRESALARGRALAEAGMTDACTITRVTGVITDPVTGVVTETVVTVYTGRCRIQQRSPGGARAVDEAEVYRLMLRMELQLPVATSAGIETGDRVTVTAAVSDPDLTGRLLLVRELAHKSEATARRLGVEEVT